MKKKTIIVLLVFVVGCATQPVSQINMQLLEEMEREVGLALPIMSANSSDYHQPPQIFFYCEPPAFNWQAQEQIMYQQPSNWQIQQQLTEMQNQQQMDSWNIQWQQFNQMHYQSEQNNKQVLQDYNRRMDLINQGQNPWP